MSARDVIAAAVWLLDREIAGEPLPAPAWATYKDNDPETAAIYETQAGVYLSALSAAGFVVVPAALMRELADDLAGHIAAHYGGSVGYPSMDLKRNRDMEPVNRARATLAAAEADHG